MLRFATLVQKKELEKITINKLTKNIVIAIHLQ